MGEDKMETKTTKKEVVNETAQKLTYEQLNNACEQLWQQNQQLTKKCKELEVFNIFKRLDYLFKVLEFSEVFDSTFTENCTKEIVELITPPSEDKAEMENK